MAAAKVGASRFFVFPVSPSRRAARVVLSLSLGLVLLLLTVGHARAADPLLPPKDANVFGLVGTSDTASNADLASTGLPLWTTTVDEGSGLPSVSFTAIGSNPFVAEKHAGVTVPVAIIPLVMRFPSGDVFDPTVGDACDHKSAVDRIVNSPLFTELDWTWGGTDVGNTQYIDAFQRAEFWQYTSPQGINPNYHVHFSVKVLDPLTWNVTGSVYSWPCPDGTPNVYGVLTGPSSYGFDRAMRTAIAQLVETGALPIGALPVFVTRNAFDQFALGWHGPTSSATVPTYIFASYVTQYDDVDTLAHELAETVNDPFDNWRYSYAGVGSWVEVADPLEYNPEPTVVSHGFAYHLSEFAFYSWFFHQTPSIGLNGWYSNWGTFTSPEP